MPKHKFILKNSSLNVGYVSAYFVANAKLIYGYNLVVTSNALIFKVNSSLSMITPFVLL